MTQLLEKALREVAKLPPSDQDAVAAIVLEELASERKWVELFERHKMPSRRWLKRLSWSIALERRSLSDCLCAREPPRSFVRCVRRCRSRFKRRRSQHTNSGPSILSIRRCDSRRSTKRFPSIQFVSIELGARSACWRKTPLSGFGWAPMTAMRRFSNAYSRRPNHAFNRTRRYGPSIWPTSVAAGRLPSTLIWLRLSSGPN